MDLNNNNWFGGIIHQPKSNSLIKVLEASFISFNLTKVHFGIRGGKKTQNQPEG